MRGRDAQGPPPFVSHQVDIDGPGKISFSSVVWVDITGSLSFNRGFSIGGEAIAEAVNPSMQGAPGPGRDESLAPYEPL